MIALVGIHLIVALALPQEYQQEVQDGNNPPETGSVSESSFSAIPPEDWQDDFDAPVASSTSIRPGVPFTGRDNGNGTATVTFTNPVTVTVNPPRMGIPIPGYSTTPRTARAPAGLQYTGPDRNHNRIPDDLENSMVDVRP